MCSTFLKFCIFVCVVEKCWLAVLYPPPLPLVPCCNTMCCCALCERHYCSSNSVGQQSSRGDYSMRNQCICNAEYNCSSTSAIPPIGTGTQYQPPNIVIPPSIGLPLPLPSSIYPYSSGYVPPPLPSPIYPYLQESRYPNTESYVDRPYGILPSPANTKYQVLNNEDCACDSPSSTCVDPCKGYVWNFNYFPDKWEPKQLFSTTWGLILFIVAIILAILILILLVVLIVSCIRSRKSTSEESEERHEYRQIEHRIPNQNYRKY